MIVDSLEGSCHLSLSPKWHANISSPRNIEKGIKEIHDHAYPCNPYAFTTLPAGTRHAHLKSHSRLQHTSHSIDKQTCLLTAWCWCWNAILIITIILNDHNFRLSVISLASLACMSTPTSQAPALHDLLLDLLGVANVLTRKLPDQTLNLCVLGSCQAVDEFFFWLRGWFSRWGWSARDDEKLLQCFCRLPCVSICTQVRD